MTISFKGGGGGGEREREIYQERNSCLGLIFNIKLDSFALYQQKFTVFVQPVLKLKTWPRVRPVN